MRKNNFFVIVFLLMATMLFTGCDAKSESIGEDWKATENIAKEFLTIRSYKVPKDYKISYVNEEHTEFTVKRKDFSATFNTKADVISIQNENVKIESTQIQIMQQIVEDFLNTTAYIPSSEYLIKYNEKNKKLIEITEKKSQLKITFDISKGLEKMQIDNISYVIHKEKSATRSGLEKLFLFILIIIGSIIILKLVLTGLGYVLSGIVWVLFCIIGSIMGL